MRALNYSKPLFYGLSIDGILFKNALFDRQKLGDDEVIEIYMEV